MANEIVFNNRIDSAQKEAGDLPARPADEGQIAAMFDRVAPRYDFLNALLSLKRALGFRRQGLGNSRLRGAFKATSRVITDSLIAVRAYDIWVI